MPPGEGLELSCTRCFRTSSPLQSLQEYALEDERRSPTWPPMPARVSGWPRRSSNAGGWILLCMPFPFWQAMYDFGLHSKSGSFGSKLEGKVTVSSYAVCARAQVEWNNARDPTKGFKYLFLSDADYTSIAARADTAVLKAEPFFAENGAPLPDTLEQSPVMAPEGM